MISEAASGIAAPGAPRAMVQGAKPGEQIAGREKIRIVVVAEDGMDVEEHLKLRSGVGKIEDGGQRRANPGGPTSASDVGNMDKRLGTLALSRGERGRKTGRVIMSGLGESGRSLLQPATETVLQCFERLTLVVQSIANEFLRVPGRTQVDRNATRGQRARQRRVAGKSFRAEEGVVLIAPSEEADGFRAGGQQTNQRLTLGRAKAVVIVIDQDQARRQRSARFHFIERAVSDQPLEYGRRRDSGKRDIRAGEITKESKAERFASARLGRRNVKIRSGKEMVMAIGRGAPKGEDGKLVIVANQIAADIGSHIIEHLATRSRSV